MLNEIYKNKIYNLYTILIRMGCEYLPNSVYLNIIAYLDSLKS